jgi:hypothetical protein
MAEKEEETPRGARFSVNLAVTCFPSTGLAGEEIQGAGREGIVKDVSSGGACIITDFPLSLSEVLKVAFPIQSSISDFISTPRTLAEVRWTYLSPDHQYVSGLHFLF